MKKGSFLLILQTIKWDYKPYSNKFEYLDEIDKFLENIISSTRMDRKGYIHKREVYENEINYSYMQQSGWISKIFI